SEIAAFAFDRIESFGRKTFPAVRQRRINLVCVFRRHDHKPRSIFLQELLRRIRVHVPSAHESVDAAPKIPNQTRLLVIDRREFHFWFKVIARLSKEFARWKEATGRGRNERDQDETNGGEVKGSTLQGQDRHVRFKPAFHEQEGKEGKRRQSVME